MRVKKSTKILDKMIDSLRQMNGLKVEWGFFEDAKYDDPRGEDSVAKIAQWVEYGHQVNVAPRPFFQIALQKHHKEIRALIKHLQRKVLQGKLSPEEKMDTIAKALKKQLEDSILDLSTPELKDSTIAARKSRGIDSDDPLLETWTLVDSVEYQIVPAPPTRKSRRTSR